MRFAAVTVLLGLFMASPAAAQDYLIDGGEPAAIVRVAERYGTARLDRDPDGDPLMIGKLGETVYIVEFFGCDDAGNDCLSIRFRASYARPGLSEQDMNDWNRVERFLKAFLDDQGDPVIHMSVNLVGGVTEDALSAVFNRWTAFMRRFEEFIEWQS